VSAMNGKRESQGDSSIADVALPEGVSSKIYVDPLCKRPYFSDRQRYIARHHIRNYVMQVLIRGINF
jgi:hypothetical protein